MNLTIVKTLTKGEQSLIMATRPKELSGLSEDALLDLHARVRRGRTKYAKLYRQQARAQVGKDASRGKASATHRRDAERAEVFEDALARVSRRLARAARASADELRTARLTAAGTARKAKATKVAKPTKKAKSTKATKVAKASKKATTPTKATKPTKKVVATKAAKTPISKKANASARASKARKQAKRDKR